MRYHRTMRGEDGKKKFFAGVMSLSGRPDRYMNEVLQRTIK